MIPTPSCRSLLVAIMAVRFWALGEQDLHFEELRLKSGPVYRDCTVTRSDPEGFLVRHEDGMARISFFDVDEEIRENFDFDPVEALKAYQVEQEKQRQIRKQALLEGEKQKAELAIAREKEERERRARATWTPVVATIAFENESGIFVRAQQVKFLPTTEKSTLGFERPGPPRRVTEPFSKDLIFLPLPRSEYPREEGEAHPEWKGYVEPQSLKRVPHPRSPGKSVPVHLAVPQP